MIAIALRVLREGKMGMRGLFGLGIAMVLVVSSTPVPAAATAAELVPTPSVSRAESERAHEFRRMFGLRDDAAYIERAAIDPEFSSENYGVPLSASEEAEMQRRVQLESDSRPAADYGMKQSSWGGYYFDQQARGAPVFMFTGGLSEHERAIQDLLPKGTDFRLQPVDQTLAELERIQADVTTAILAYRASGVRITSVGVDLLGNRVTVGIQGLTSGRASEIKQQFGPDIDVHEEAPARSDACPVSDCRPIKGGIRMIGADGFRGTAGFIVRRYAHGARLSVLTAGHILWVQNPATGGLNMTFYHDTASGANNVFGDAKYQAFTNMSVGDVGLIEIDDDEAPSAANRMFISANPESAGSVYTITDVVEDWYQTVGSQACAYGSESNDSFCATVTQYSMNHESCADPNPGLEVCNTIQRTKGYQYNLVPGDSGGPIYQVATSTTRYALGTHVHSVEGNKEPNFELGWYTPYVNGTIAYTNAAAAAGADDAYYICVTASC